MVERGRPVEHITDYTTALTPPWELPHHGKAPKKLLEDYPVTARVYNKVSEYTAHFYTPDRHFPYLEESRFDWIRGYQLGGKSLTWGRIALRYSDLDFEANAKEGIAIDWPIRYRDLAPWYDKAERFVGIAGSREGLPHLPDGIFQPPMPLNCVELDLKENLKKSHPGVHLIHARQAHLTLPTEEQLSLGRGSCQFRNMCSRGCPYGAYFSSQSASLPAARRTNNLTTLTHAIVTQVVYDDTKQRAIGINDAVAGQIIQLVGKNGGMVSVHAELGKEIERLRDEYYANGFIEPRNHPLSRPPQMEAKSVENLIKLNLS